MSEHHIVIRNLHRYVYVYVCECECKSDSIWRSPAFSLLLTKVCNYWEDWEHVERLCVHRSGHVLCISGPTSDGASSLCPCSAAAYNGRMQATEPCKCASFSKAPRGSKFSYEDAERERDLQRRSIMQNSCRSCGFHRSTVRLLLGECAPTWATQGAGRKTHFSESLCVSPEKDYAEESLQFNSYTD